MEWCFAIVNNKLAEIFFNRKNNQDKIWAHCYVKEKDYKTKQEKKWIEKDTAKLKLIYRNKKYEKIIP